MTRNQADSVRTPTAVRTPTTNDNRFRAVLILAGICLTIYGVVLVLTGLRINNIIGLGLWLAAAVIAHDFVLVPAVTVVARLLFSRRPAPSPTATGAPDVRRRGSGHRLLAVVRPKSAGSAFAGSRYEAITRSLLVAACLVSVIVAPEIWAQRRGVANPTILPGDYAQNLLALWVVVLAVSAIVLIVGLIAVRRSR
ncbi:hypothetical protein [Brevibacterium atlanticum]|uniref:hypothetical protein n=1 Tax=Brevibacterium atlanticum TaxID=2697563 RepID=UPI0014204862|nr:hypothetical protein [Brevibacterium atlanticum]